MKKKFSVSPNQIKFMSWIVMSTGSMVEMLSVGLQRDKRKGERGTSERERERDVV
jgi:hypothetical protein